MFKYITRNGKYLTRNGKLRTRGPRPETGERLLTFSVKEWFLDPDNSFSDTEVGALDNMVVKINGVEQRTNSLGQTFFILPDNSLYHYEVYDMVRYLTTKKGSVFLSENTLTVDVKIYACLYTPAQINTMISVDGYIPVASATELDGLRNATGRRMGQGTIFDTVSDVTTGLDKKYVQVGNVDFSGFSVWNSIGSRTDDSSSFTGNFDGNELVLVNYIMIGNTANEIFGIIKNAFIGNLKIYNTDKTGTDRPFLFTQISVNSNSNTIIENIIVFGSAITRTAFLGIHNYSTLGIIRDIQVINLSVTGNLTETCGLIYSNKGLISNITITDAHVISNGGSAGNGGAILCGENTGVVENIIISSSSIDSGTLRKQIGSIVGINTAGGIVRKCGVVNVSVSGAGNVGGIVGSQFTLPAALTENCYFVGGSVQRNGINTADCNGLIVGRNIDSATIKNSFSSGTINKPATGKTGGVTGENLAVIINCYWNNIAIALTSDVFARTTAQLKNGTADSFINPDGTVDGTNNPANAMFTGWDDTIWDFSDITKYPELI
jgi:hypothetical protein